jgi:hypothetical protein
MVEASFEEVVRLAERLTQEEQTALIELLRAKLSSPRDRGITRERALSELEQLRLSGAFENAGSLRGKYARPDLDISAAELSTYLHEIGTEWEQELDESFDEN